MNYRLFYITTNCDNIFVIFWKCNKFKNGKNYMFLAWENINVWEIIHEILGFRIMLPYMVISFLIQNTNFCFSIFLLFKINYGVYFNSNMDYVITINDIALISKDKSKSEQNEQIYFLI